VANLNKVKMSKKMKSRFITHIIVFGILSLISIENCKRKEFLVNAMSYCYILPVPLFLSNVFDSKQPPPQIRTMGSMAFYPNK
jgi:hypothetical protein